MSAAHPVSIAADPLPLPPAVIRPPQLTGFRRLSLPRHAVARFEERVHTFGVRRCDRDHRFANSLCRKAASRELLPRRAGIVRDIETAAGPTALASPCLDVEGPH